MRFSNRLAAPLVAAAFLPGLAQAALGIAGAIDNALQASLLQGAADLLDVGNYIIKNVKTGQALTYTPVGNHVVPSDGAGTPVAVSHYSDAVSWIRLQLGEKNKCLSAQWGGSYDHAGVMYECAVFGGGAVKADNTLEPTKQWWLLVPVGSDLSGTDSSAHSVSFLAAAQEDSVKTREDAIASGQTKNAFGKHRRAALLKRIIRTPVTKKTTTTTTTQTTTVVAAVDTTEKKKSSSKKTKSKSKSKSKSSKKKSKSKSKSSKAKSSSSSSSSGSSSAVQLNVVNKAASTSSDQKYYIIAVDHLIDMHTMALIGQSIPTAGNTQSTALATFTPDDTLQQWTITKA